ncbi:MAG: bifunctional DNA primase/polymerase, partial [Deltaproteobacteria bacterium]|nr:bifunctional DNA primase/polymerase [Deltaproteobacteria bacterium]
MGTPFLEIALKYLDRGFSVIPIKANKKPYIKWEEFQKRRPTPEEVGAWWGKWPKAMIGICTGEISGILVIDCDTPEGYEAIQKLLPDAILLPVARTPRGGWHLWFLYPAGSKITVGTGIMPGVDFRAEGGYVITPPSINGDGKGYT